MQDIEQSRAAHEEEQEEEENENGVRPSDATER